MTDTLPDGPPPGMEQRVNANRESDFQQLWATAEGRVRIFLRAAVSSREDRKDLLQTIAQQALASYHRFCAPKGSFTSWLLGIARNEYLHFLRSQARAPVLFDSDLADRALELLGRDDQNEDHDFENRLKREIDRLPPARYDLLHMKYSENLTCKQIATRLSLTEDAVKMRISRIRADLKKTLLPFTPHGKP